MNVTVDHATKERLVSVAVAKFGVPREGLEFGAGTPLPPSKCLIFSAQDKASTNPFSSKFAVLEDGTVLDADANGVFDRVLGECFPGGRQQPQAASLAQVIVDLYPTPGPLVLIDPQRRGWASWMANDLAAAGKAYAQPSLSERNGLSELHFFAANADRHVVVEVNASRQPGGQLTVEFTELPSA